MSRAGKDLYEQAGVAMTCRSFSEYEKMFMLQGNLLNRGPILDVAAGASSFTAEASARGYEAIAVDPQYVVGAEEIYAHGSREIASSTEKIRKIAHTYHWDYYGDIDAHRLNREQSLERFIADYSADHKKSRYIPAVLPELPFQDGQFSLILTSHFLFLYHEQFDFDFHLQAVRELMRVCRSGGEIRLFPLVSYNREPYPELNRLIEAIQDEGLQAEFLPTDFRFLAGAEEFLRISRL